MEKRADIVDGNGEIIGVINVGDRIVRATSKPDLEETDIWNIEHFYKGHIDEIQSLMSALSVFEKAFLFSVATYVGYEDCCIKHRNGKILSFDDLLKVSGMSKGKLSETLNTLKHKDIIYRGVNSKGIQYFINPWLFCKGTRINKVLKTMFENYNIRIFNSVAWKDLKGQG